MAPENSKIVLWWRSNPRNRVLEGCHGQPQFYPLAVRYDQELGSHHGVEAAVLHATSSLNPYSLASLCQLEYQEPEQSWKPHKDDRAAIIDAP